MTIDPFPYLLQAFLSVVRDGTVWSLAGPAIFRLNLHFAAASWENHAGSEPIANSINFRTHRFLAYYTVHLTTFIVAWILFLVRFGPDFGELIVSLKATGISTWSVIFGVIWAGVCIIGIFIFWLTPRFVTPELIEAYRRHNDPTVAASARDKLLGPTSPPVCELTSWRRGFLWFSVIVAALRPLFP